jgi:hypothetical protein
MRLAECVDGGNNSRLVPGVLKQDACDSSRSSGAIWRRLLPIQLDKLYGDLSMTEYQLIPTVAPVLNRKLGQRHKQRVFVSGHEVALVEESLQFGQKQQLRFWQRWGRCHRRLQ